MRSPFIWWCKRHYKALKADRYLMLGCVALPVVVALMGWLGSESIIMMHLV